MAHVIEQAIVRISPSFDGFRDDLLTGIKEATAGVHGTVDVKLNVDSRHLHSSIETALAGIPKTKSTIKLDAEFDRNLLKTSFKTALAAATQDAASTVAAAKVRVDINRTFLKTSLESAVREAIRSVNAVNNSVKIHVDPVIDRKKLDAELLKLSQKTVTIKVRYDTSGAPSLPGGGSLRVPAGGGGGGGNRPPNLPGTGGSGGSSGHQRIGSSSSQSASTAAEFINALPGIGGFGPNAARVLLQGLAVASPAIAATLSGAVASAFGAGTIAAAIAVSVADPRVSGSFGDLGRHLLDTLTGAARPFTEELLTIIPKFGRDFDQLRPKILGVFSALAPSLGRLEQGLIGGLQNAINPQVGSNAAQFIDVIASKLPAMGTAVNQFLVAMTDPKNAQFLGDFIDFIDKIIVGLGKVVGFLAQVNQGLADLGVYKTLGTVLGTLFNTIGNIANAFGPGLTATIVAAGGAMLLFGRRSTTASAEATTGWNTAKVSWLSYVQSLRTGVPAAEAAQAAAARGGPGFLGGARSAGGTAALIGLPIIGSLIGQKATDSGHPVLGGVISGAAGGAALGSLIGSIIPGIGTGVGAIGGAIIGGTIGGVTAGGTPATPLDATRSSAQQLGRDWVKSHDPTTFQASYVAASANDKTLQNLTRLAPKLGMSVPDLFELVGKGDWSSIEKSRNAHQAKIDATGNWFARSPAESKAYRALGGSKGVDDEKDLVKALDVVEGAAKDEAAALAKNTAAVSANAMPSGTPPWVRTVFEELQARMSGTVPPGQGGSIYTTSTGANIAPQMQSVNLITDTYRSYLMAQRGVKDAEYQRSQTQQQTAAADEAAIHAVADAEHGLAQAHFATEMAQRSLTDARKQAIQNLTELKRQTRDLDDNEESLKIRVIEADLAEQQTRGIDPMALVRRKAILEQHAAHNALTDFQEDRPVLMDKVNTANQRGVEGDTGVLSAKNSLAESQRNEVEQARNVKLAHDNLNNTLEASRRANELACRAVDDANYALGRQANQLIGLAASTGLSVSEIRNLYEASRKVDREFVCTINTKDTAKIAMSEVADLYNGLVQLAGVFGITLPGWSPSAPAAPTGIPGVTPGVAGPHLPILPPAPSTLPGGGPGGFKGHAEGGVIDGHSPHDRADNIPAWLTADEYVVNAKSSRRHRGLLHAINADRYADGGLVLPFGTPVKNWQAPARANLAELFQQSGSGGSGTNGDISSVQSWLRSGADPLPYVWGNVGPSAFDCSGLVGEVWARLTGHPSNTRYFVTGNERQFLTSHGFRDGTGTFTVGFSADHTMGNIGGLNFEAANARSGIHVGSGTSDVTSFPNVMYLPQFGDRFIGSGGMPPDVSAVHVGGIWGQIMRKILTDAKVVALGGGGDSGKADAADANVARIAYDTAKAMGADPKSLLALFEAGIVESGMQNLDYGDRDSLGFLQQRASWGSAASRQNVADSTRRFLNKAMRLSGSAATAGSLAQDVQVSAFPDRYDRNRNAAIALLSRFDKNLQFGGFDNGGWLRDVGVNTSGTPEAVLTNEQSRAYVRHAESLSGSGGEVRLDEWTISRLAQAMSTRPIPVNVDGRHVADAVVPHLERRIRR